ncbi:hypothetical protein V1478_008264, partial [Vespula squamosa]
MFRSDYKTCRAEGNSLPYHGPLRVRVIGAHPPAGDGLVVSRRHPRHRTATTLAHECQVGSNDCKGCRGGAKSEQGSKAETAVSVFAEFLLDNILEMRGCCEEISDTERVRNDTNFDQREDKICYNGIANEDRFTIGWVGHQFDIHIVLLFDRSQLKRKNWKKPTMMKAKKEESKEKTTLPFLSRVGVCLLIEEKRGRRDRKTVKQRRRSEAM